MNPRALVLGLLLTLSAHAAPSGLLFSASFDKLSPDADFAKGDPHSSLKESLELRSTEGIKGSGLLLRKGERCTYAIAGNLDTSQGSYVAWVKPLNWDGHSGKFRHLMVALPDETYRLMIYLYPIGDEAVFNYLDLHPKGGPSIIFKAGSPVDILKKGEWVQIVSTWDAKAVKLYANGKRVADGLVTQPLPKLTTGTFTICPVDYWGHPQWGDPNEQTICDEVRVYDHALNDDEVLDLYAAEVPGGLKDLKPGLTLSLQPHYEARSFTLGARPAHLDTTWQQRVAAGASAQLTLRDPRGRACFDQAVKLPADGTTVEVPVGDWVDGDYTATGKLTAGTDALAGTATATKPPTPWLPAQKDWRADRVLEPWTALRCQGNAVELWNGKLELDGALPRQWTVQGQPVLAAPIRLVADAPARWDAPKAVEDKPYRASFTGAGQLGALTARYDSLIEFDGLYRADLTLTPPAGGADVPALTLEVPLRPEVARFYRNTFCAPWDGQALAEQDFRPYGWLGNESRGLSWFMESDANWIHEGPAVTLRREGDQVLVRLRLIGKPTRITKPLTYTIGFEPTPVRPLPADRYDVRFASGPQMKGSNLFVYGWGQQISTLNGTLIARDPADQRKLVDGWRKQGKLSLDYTCNQCTANTSAEYLFFAQEWNQPYGATFSGYKRAGDNAPYSMVGVCPQSSFADFLLWGVKENLEHDWSDGIYTDIDGGIPCDNPLHGCGFTDSFGRSGRTWPLYAHRSLSRRIYALCHDHGKRYFSHAHSDWYSLFNAFNDGWCPGEQYSSAVMGKPAFYMDNIADAVWRSEFCSPTTGVPTYLLPELGRLAGDEATKDRGPTETLMVASMSYGVPLWAGSMNQQVLEEVWDVQQRFGMKDATFVPFWEPQDVAASEPGIRVSQWKTPGRRLVVVANFSGRPETVTLRAAKPGATLAPAWNAKDAQPDGGGLKVTVPAKSGVLLTVTWPEG